MSPKKKKIDLSYQEALQELESIVSDVEGEEQNIDVLSERIERALQLINHCRTKLHDTENKIQKAFETDESDEE